MKAVLAAAVCLLAQAVTVTASAVDKRLALPPQLKKRYGMKYQTEVDIDLVGNGTFTQLLDHENPSAGTFKQRYFFTSEYYESGGPISESSS